MDKLAILKLINDKASSIDLYSAMQLADALEKAFVYPTANDEPTRTEMIKYLAKHFDYGPGIIGSDSKQKNEAIKMLRNQFEIGLVEAKNAVDWYIDHPDPMFW